MKVKCSGEDEECKTLLYCMHFGVHEKEGNCNEAYCEHADAVVRCEEIKYE